MNMASVWGYFVGSNVEEMDELHVSEGDILQIVCSQQDFAKVLSGSKLEITLPSKYSEYSEFILLVKGRARCFYFQSPGGRNITSCSGLLQKQSREFQKELSRNYSISQSQTFRIS